MTAFRVILYVLTFCISVYVLIREPVPYNEIAAAIIAAFILIVTDKMYDNTSRFKYLYYSIRYFNSKVRVSISYLYRIKNWREVLTRKKST